MKAIPLCNTCVRPAGVPFRVWHDGKIVSGCIDAFHADHLVSPSASSSWHNRPAAKKHRAAVAAHLRSL